MNGNSARRFPTIRTIVFLGGLVLVGGAWVYVWLRSTESWGSVGTIGGYDARPDRNKSELRLRGSLHQWLEQQGFREAILPKSLAESRGSDWSGSINAPVVYQGSVEGDNLYVVTWDDADGGVKFWKANVYYRDVPADIQWLPGAETGHDSAVATFERARAFVGHERDAANAAR